MRRSWSQPLEIALACLIGAMSASEGLAVQIRFQAEDLNDGLGPGGDLWRYSYRVSGFDFEADQGFSVEFDESLYASLESPAPPVHDDWGVLSFQPAVSLGVPGLYDALALVGDPSLSEAFTLTFIWLGGPAAPGAQPFTINQFDSQGTFLGELASGVTVPTPAPALLLVFGLGVLCARWTRAERGSYRADPGRFLRLQRARVTAVTRRPAERWRPRARGRR